MVTERIILEIEFDQEGAEQRAAALKKEILEQQKELAKLNKEAKASKTITKEQSDAIAKLDGTLKNNRKAYNGVQTSITTADKAQKASTRTIQGLRDRVKGLNQELDNTDIGSKRFNELQVETKETREELRKLEADAGKTTATVGTIADGFKNLGNSIATAFGVGGSEKAGESIDR